MSHSTDDGNNAITFDPFGPDALTPFVYFRIDEHDNGDLTGRQARERFKSKSPVSVRPRHSSFWTGLLLFDDFEMEVANGGSVISDPLCIDVRWESRRLFGFVINVAEKTFTIEPVLPGGVSKPVIVDAGLVAAGTAVKARVRSVWETKSDLTSASWDQDPRVTEAILRKHIPGAPSNPPVTGHPT